MKNHPYLIIGQGLAGTLLHHTLGKHGLQAVIVDKSGNSASNITSGLMNPLTGRKYVKSWKYDQLVAKATEVYDELSRLLNHAFIQQLPILRALPDRNAEIEWDYRTTLDDYTSYVGREDEVEFAEVDPYIKQKVPFVRIKGGYRVDVPRLIKDYRMYLNENQIIDDHFNYDRLNIRLDGVEYNDSLFKGIIFCEGAGAIHNPFFCHLPFNLSKGEAMVGKVPFHLKRMVKNKTFLVPWAKDEMWVGSANFWNFDHDRPTEEGQNRMWEQMSKFYRGPFEKVRSLAAIKPSVKDRRPFLGTHDEHSCLHIFNGLGTKGVSLGPFFAEAMVQYLLGQKPLIPEVNINRFELRSS